MLAAYHGHAPLVKLLLQHGADPNSLNDRGQSPLAGAVFKGEADVVEVSDRPRRSFFLVIHTLNNFRATAPEPTTSPQILMGSRHCLQAEQIQIMAPQVRWRQ